MLSLRPIGARPAGGWLALAVHMDAVRLAPAAYLAAAWWRLCGKRLRARNRLAPLLGASPRAYRLWLERQDAACGSGAGPGVGPGAGIASPPIVAIVAAIVDCEGRVSSHDHRLLDMTLQSLREAEIPALILKAPRSAEEPAGLPLMASLAEVAEKIDWSVRPWLLQITAGDVLAVDASRIYREAIVAAQADTRILYADDDLRDAAGRRTAPHLKPDWNSELFRHFDYISGACLVRADKADLLAVGAVSDWPRALVARVAGDTVPVHVRRVLHHRRARPHPQVPAVPVASGGVLPPVTVIVPTRNRADLLRSCLDGLAATNYPQIEVIVVDNDSDEPETLALLGALDELYPGRARVLRHAGAFNFAEMNNRAVEAASSPIVCLLNNDVEMLDADWLRTMVAPALRDDVGAVGARLLYPDGRIQHAGVVIGVGGGAAHGHRFLREGEEGYFRRHELPQFVSAVTAACMVLQRDRFRAVGGFDARSFAVAFNDVDLCLKLNGKGWQSFYEPRARLVHHESVSRGLDRDPVSAFRFAGELASLKRDWGTDRMVDPYHHPSLSPFSEQFVVGL